MKGRPGRGIAFFEENKTQYPKMDIKIPFLTVRETLQYKPARNASLVTCPSLVVIAAEDTVNPPEQGKALFDAIGAKNKQLFEERGARHYDVSTGEHFRRSGCLVQSTPLAAFTGKSVA